ncbi:MAG: peptidylprolyl isomerase [Candidatus Brocadiia bacterium]
MNDQNSVVEIETTKGSITVQLWADEAPKTVDNFLQYVDDAFYDGTVFHRVIPGFMIQGGGMAEDLKKKPTRDPIANEASSDKKNQRGTIAMARTGEINSATSQFFINLADNDFLDHVDETPEGFGYAAFGEVTDGMDVVDEIAQTETASKGPHENVPKQPIIIKKIRRVEP